jgi:hypothetical protein
MDFSAGERAVLGQIRALYANSARRDHPIRALTVQWPSLHCDAYTKAFGGLVAKRLIQLPPGSDVQWFEITDAGLRSMGVAVWAPAARAEPPKPRRRARALIYGFGTMAFVAMAGVSWRLFFQ